MNTPTPTFERVSKESVAFLGTGPVPAAPYYDPAYFELEREAVFKRNWLQIGHMCELPEPGSFIRREVEVAKASVLIVRGKDDVVRAFYNVCTHRGTQLVDAECGKQATFSCPYHMWTFDQKGALLSAPDMDEFYVSKADCSLPTVEVEVCAGLIFIHLGKPEKSLREWLGPLADGLEQLPVAKATTFSEYTYEIDANWKLNFDNFQENYHVRFIHPAAGPSACPPENPFGYPAAYGFHGSHRTQTLWNNPNPPAPGPVQGTAYATIGGRAARDGYMASAATKEYYALFPNFFLLGSPVLHFSHMVMPIAVDKSRGVVRLYWVDDDANASERFGRELCMASARDVHVEDRHVIRAGQKGLASGALKHIHFQAQESLCRHLFNEVDGMVRAYKAELEAKGAMA